MDNEQYSQRIAAELDESDSFAFEMEILLLVTELLRTNTHFQKTHEIEHGGIYIDPTEGKRRQFDIRVRHFISSDTLLLGIECKRLHWSSPVVVSRTTRKFNESYHYLLEQPIAFGGEIQKFQSRRQQYSSDLYELEKQVGKSIANPKMNGSKIDLSNDSGIFDRYSQAIASVEGMLIDEIRRISSMPPHGSPLGPRIAAIPIMVVPDNCLWVVDYDDDGKRTTLPKTEERVEVFLGREVPNLDCEGRFEISHLHIATVSGLKKLARSLLGLGGPALSKVFFPK